MRSRSSKNPVGRRWINLPIWKKSEKKSLILSHSCKYVPTLCCKKYLSYLLHHNILVFDVNVIHRPIDVASRRTTRKEHKNVHLLSISDETVQKTDTMYTLTFIEMQGLLDQQRIWISIIGFHSKYETFLQWNVRVQIITADKNIRALFTSFLNGMYK